MGNSTYASSPLLNPLNDANSIAIKLESLGFETILGLDLTRREMIEKIEQFGQMLTAESTGLVYYSGHGFQINGENFLLPVGEGIDHVLLNRVDIASSVQESAVSLNLILDGMRAANNVQNIIILDSCRENPVSNLGKQYQGFAEMHAPPRTYIAYATSPGKLAWDGIDGNHGVFTNTLLTHLNKPNLSIQELFQTVRKEVAEKNRRFSNYLGHLYP